MRPRSKRVADRVAADGMPLRAIAIVGNREIGDFTGNLTSTRWALTHSSNCSGAVMLVGSGRFRSRLLSCSFCSLFVDSPAPDVLDALGPRYIEGFQYTTLGARSEFKLLEQGVDLCHVHGAECQILDIDA